MIEVGLFLPGHILKELDSGIVSDEARKRVSAKLGFEKLGLPGCVTGEQSFATILQKHLNRIPLRKVECLPNKDHPFPREGEKYFHGAYCTGIYSRMCECVDAFQIESPKYLRVDEYYRKQYVKALANSIIEYSQ